MDFDIYSNSNLKYFDLAYTFLVNKLLDEFFICYLHLRGLIITYDGRIVNEYKYTRN